MDGVAMAALPSCIVITCSKGTKEVERKVRWGKTGTGARGTEGTDECPGDLSVLQLCRACCVSVSVCLEA